MNEKSLLVQPQHRLDAPQFGAPLLRRFAIIRLWPDKAVAEHENIERFASAAARIGVEMIEVDRYGYTLKGVKRQITHEDVDFVLHLHYETPKTYDAFSYGILWNPLEFYHEWGYQHYIRNQLSHDAFISAGATLVEDIVIRSRPEEFRRGGFPILNHSLCDPVLPPTRRTDRRAFYCGINWERITGKPGRHSEILKLLDTQKAIVIYGPRQLDNVRPWDGYDCYRGSLPFDGRSIIHAASEAGIVLVLSSDAHKKSGIMSNRLFECLAAGALIIGDKHPFLVEHFSDCALFFDENKKPEEQADEVARLIEWANESPDEAYEMTVRAQERFRRDYMLDTQLGRLFVHHAGVVAKARARRGEEEMQGGLVDLLLIPLSYEETFLRQFAASLAGQTSSRWRLCVAVPSEADRPMVLELFSERLSDKVEVIVSKMPRKEHLVEIGRTVAAMSRATDGDYLVVLQGIETLHRDFVEVLHREFARDGDREVVAFNHLLMHMSGENTHIDVQDIGFKKLHPSALGALALRRTTYEELRPYLDYLSVERWVELLSIAAYRGSGRHYPPTLVCRMTEWEREMRKVEGAASRLNSQQQEQIVADYISACSSSGTGGGSNGGMLINEDYIRRVARPLVDHALSVPGIRSLDLETRRQISATLLGALPWPRPILGLMKRFYRINDRREKKVQTKSGSR